MRDFGVGEQVMDALIENRGVRDTLQMIDSTIIRAHHQSLHSVEFLPP